VTIMQPAGEPVPVVDAGAAVAATAAAAAIVEQAVGADGHSKPMTVRIEQDPDHPVPVTSVPNGQQEQL